MTHSLAIWIKGLTVHIYLTCPGKTIPLPRGHAHLAVFMDDKDYNFTHRISKLSFGDPAPGIVHPLEGDEEVADKSKW